MINRRTKSYYFAEIFFRKPLPNYTRRGILHEEKAFSVWAKAKNDGDEREDVSRARELLVEDTGKASDTIKKIAKLELYSIRYNVFDIDDKKRSFSIQEPCAPNLQNTFYLVSRLKNVPSAFLRPEFCRLPRIGNLIQGCKDASFTLTGLSLEEALSNALFVWELAEQLKTISEN